LPEIVLEELKMLANKRDVPYQSLLKYFWRKNRRRAAQEIRRLTNKNQEEKVVLSGLEKIEVD